MQFDSQRAFPYPVLRPDVNDYTDGEFQAIVDLSYPDNATNFHLDAQFALSVDEIAQAIEKGDAKFVLVLSCRDTYWRTVIETKSTKVSAEFPTGALRGEVQIFPYIIADNDIASFECPLINSEFGAGPFAFVKGAVLAIDEPTAVYVDRDLFKPITSIFELVVNENIHGPEWQLDCSSEHVRIGLSAKMKERVDASRNETRNKAILINSVYFAAVMQCIEHLRGSDYDHLRWAQIMREKCHNDGIVIDSSESYAVAEKLLKLPLSLLSTYVFEEAAGA